MSEQQHAVDIEADLPHQDSGASSGGACLNRHLGDPPQAGANKSCSHRWQAYLQMKSDSSLYDWPKYKSLSTRKTRIRTAMVGGGENFPDWYRLTLAQPKEGEWDVTGNNFFTKCYIPYWHECTMSFPIVLKRSDCKGR
ncbi:MAG: hypothetical protein R3C53_26955 [Pirellulaceae bacterium]